VVCCCLIRTYVKNVATTSRARLALSLNLLYPFQDNLSFMMVLLNSVQIAHALDSDLSFSGWIIGIYKVEAHLASVCFVLLCPSTLSSGAAEDQHFFLQAYCSWSEQCLFSSLDGAPLPKSLPLQICVLSLAWLDFSKDLVEALSNC